MAMSVPAARGTRLPRHFSTRSKGPSRAYRSEPDEGPPRLPGRVRPYRCHASGQDQAAGGDAGAGGDQDGAVAGDLVDGGAADLADRLGDAVHAVDVGLAQLAAVGIDRQAAVQLDRAAGDEIPGLAAPAEAEFLQLDEHVGGEVVVQ